MSIAVPAEQAAGVLDRGLDIVELFPDVPFFRLSVSVPEGASLPQLAMRITGGTEGCPNTTAVNRVLWVVGGSAAKAGFVARSPQLTEDYFGSVQLPYATIKVGSLATQSAASVEGPTKGTITGARSFSSFLGQLALPVGAVSAGLQGAAVNMIEAMVTNDSEGQRLRTVLNGTANEARPVLFGTEVTTPMWYVLNLASGATVSLKMLDTRPEAERK